MPDPVVTEEHLARARAELAAGPPAVGLGLDTYEFIVRERAVTIAYREALDRLTSPPVVTLEPTREERARARAQLEETEPGSAWVKRKDLIDERVYRLRAEECNAPAKAALANVSGALHDCFPDLEVPADEVLYGQALRRGHAAIVRASEEKHSAHVRDLVAVLLALQDVCPMPLGGPGIREASATVKRHVQSLNERFNHLVRLACEVVKARKEDLDNSMGYQSIDHHVANLAHELEHGVTPDAGAVPQLPNDAEIRARRARHATFGAWTAAVDLSGAADSFTLEIDDRPRDPLAGVDATQRVGGPHVRPYSTRPERGEVAATLKAIVDDLIARADVAADPEEGIEDGAIVATILREEASRIRAGEYQVPDAAAGESSDRASAPSGSGDDVRVAPRAAEGPARSPRYEPAPLPTEPGKYLAYTYNDEEPRLVEVFRDEHGLHWWGRNDNKCSLQHNKIEWVQAVDGTPAPLTVDDADVPDGYHVWDFYEDSEEGRRGRKDWMWAADGSAMDRDREDVSRAEAIAAARAHRDRVVAAERSRSPAGASAKQRVRAAAEELFGSGICCLDGGCLFGHPGGMHTNGGCQALKERDLTTMRHTAQKLSRIAHYLAGAAR